MHGTESVWDYPRPPRLEQTPLLLKVVYTSQSGVDYEVASTSNGWRVLETSHPPTYYLPREDVKMEWLDKTARHSFCEWKGIASYFTFIPPESEGSPSAIVNRIWTYESPTPSFIPIKDHLAFYASSASSPGTTGLGEWKCFVDGEKVVAQDGDFYGGWKTSWITGKMKGGPGTQGW